MFLLLLMVLGTVSVKAQVRIGGNGAPNAAAVLDLNATDGTTGTKGLALPRVSLTNATTALTGTPTLNGMIVYNTNATMIGGSGVGIYYWVTNKWEKMINSDDPVPLNRIVTTMADSGRVLQSNGVSAVWTSQPYPVTYASYSLRLNVPNLPVTWALVLDTTFTPIIAPWSSVVVPTTGAYGALFCTEVHQSGDGAWYHIQSYVGQSLRIFNNSPNANRPIRIRCFAPSV